MSSLADVRFADVTAPDGREASIAFGIVDGGFHAGGGWDRQTAMLNMMKSIYPELRQMKIAPGAWSEAAAMFAGGPNRDNVVIRDDMDRPKRRRHDN